MAIPTNPSRDNSGPSKPPPHGYTLRLNPEAYKQVAKQCKPLDVGTQTTELQAAFILGQQSVLDILRRDIVVNV